MAGTRIGQRVGPFELAERLEGDDHFSLFRAIRPAGSRAPRVVSIRLAEDPRDERSAAWIRNEYDTLRALSEPGHPSIPRPYGYYASQVAVALEDLPRVSLADALKLRADGRIPLDAATAVDILVELAQCLRQAHSVAGPQGTILHGHMHPEQVRLLATGGLRLAGFGRPSSRRSPSYTAPEQAAGAFMDARTDQWSLGALGVEMLLGQALYAGTPDPMGLALQGRVGPWLDRLERRWPEVCRVLARCLAPAAGDRYNREADLVRDLLAAARTIGGRADISALAGRIQALLPSESTLPGRGASEEAAGDAPSVPTHEEPPGETTLVPSEDDVDPSSVRGAALRPFAPDEAAGDQATSHDPVWQTQEAWEQANALPPSLAASSHPAAKRARAARLEEQRRPPVSEPQAEPEPAALHIAAAAPEEPSSPAEGPPETPAFPQAAPPDEAAEEPTAGDPAPATPSAPVSPSSASDDERHDAREEDEPTQGGNRSEDGEDSEDSEDIPGLELDQTEEAPRSTLHVPAGASQGASPGPEADPVEEDSGSPAPQDATAAPPATVVPEFSLDDEPIKIQDLLEETVVPASVEGLRWTELLAVVMVAALLVTGATFLLGLLG